MRAVPIGIGELKVSNAAGDVLRSYGLGSCIGLVVLAPRQRTVGMLHVALPESKINLQLAKDQPGMFADTGIPFLLQEMERLGCSVGDMVIKIAGGVIFVNSVASTACAVVLYLALRFALERAKLLSKGE